ncbi:MAG: hypothetical protein SFW67_12915 [Myxococcaceae bacterium]|nr:hypothetical protein [Myxococcaceae bacterium]
MGRSRRPQTTNDIENALGQWTSSLNDELEGFGIPQREPFAGPGPAWGWVCQRTSERAAKLPSLRRRCPGCARRLLPLFALRLRDLSPAFANRVVSAHSCLNPACDLAIHDFSSTLFEQSDAESFVTFHRPGAHERSRFHDGIPVTFVRTRIEGYVGAERIGGPPALGNPAVDDLTQLYRRFRRSGVGRCAGCDSALKTFVWLLKPAGEPLNHPFQVFFCTRAACRRPGAVIHWPQ